MLKILIQYVLLMLLELWLGCTYPENFISWFDPSVTLMCFHTSNSESYNWWKLHKHIFFEGLSVWFAISAKCNSYIWILLSASSFPTGSSFKPLWHSSNLLLHLLFSGDENLNKTAFNCQALPLPINLSIFTFVLSYPFGSWPFFSVSTLISALPEP